ncbi:MAG TPA: hypothetical protein DEB39_13345 [Planctomycetaceae bacterium]|nr:hypothetical protein [Planctomycetaceae bacterium]
MNMKNDALGEREVPHRVELHTRRVENLFLSACRLCSWASIERCGVSQRKAATLPKERRRRDCSNDKTDSQPVSVSGLFGSVIRSAARRQSRSTIARNSPAFWAVISSPLTRSTVAPLFL